MKKRILCLLLALMLALLAFSLVSCGDNDDDDDDDDRKSSSSKNDKDDEKKDEITFDDVLEMFEDIESEESGVMLNTFEGEDEAKSALESSFGGDILDDFDGELKNALLCNYIGDSNFWAVMVFECGDEKDAESLAEWLDIYNEEDDTYYTAENGLFIIASSEYMIDVVLGEEEYEIDNNKEDDGARPNSDIDTAESNLRDDGYTVMTSEVDNAMMLSGVLGEENKNITIYYCYDEVTAMDMYEELQERLEMYNEGVEATLENFAKEANEFGMSLEDYLEAVDASYLLEWDKENYQVGVDMSNYVVWLGHKDAIKSAQ
ncbi:MAG: hypothetical protein J6B45_02355 [Clostridia bacterium]|nr:hypothetical protein [Clostridia bacterium]